MHFAVMASKTKTSNCFWYKCIFKVAFVLLLTTHQARAEVQDDDVFLENEQFDEIPSPPLPETVVVAQREEEDEVLYATPKPPPGSYIAETFDDIIAFGKTWVKSKAKKDAVDADISKYDGVWSVEEPLTPLLKGDRGLVLKSKAKHAAIAAPLSRPFKFGAKAFVVQYEVNLQDGQECGGAYIKLLSFVEGKGTDLNQFHDKSPYTIMFGPDKCGNDFKLHFIFRHVNPVNGSIEEKHAKRPLNKIEEVFKDKRPHLYTLVLRPDNSFDISLDHTVVNSGHLLEDFTPPVNPEKEIIDPEDKKPVDWDEREKIADPDDKKPEDWDDDAPKKIPDPDAAKPSGWLEDQPEMMPDPEAVRPDDWDNEMDGEWEAPLVTNPACTDAPGCGPWSRPIVDNPAYRGKWRPRLITNPNYRGQWLPRMVPNPGYFEDLEPFKMTPINAVGFELWSMSGNILFDNIIITESVAEARQFAEDTFDLKMSKLEKGKGGVVQRILDYSNERPWLYAVYVLLAAVPVVVIIMCCCASTSDKADEGQAERKKTDAATSDDPDQDGEAAEREEEEEEERGAGHDEEEEADEEAGEVADEEEEEEEEVDEDKGEAGAGERSSQEEDADEEDEDKDKREENDSDKQESGDKPSSPRQRRKARRD